MSRFYASMQGRRGIATRCGDARSGITAHIRGWDVGVEVCIGVDNHGRDSITIYQTGGSHSPSPQKVIGYLVGPEPPKPVSNPKKPRRRLKTHAQPTFLDTLKKDEKSGPGA